MLETGARPQVESPVEPGTNLPEDQNYPRAKMSRRNFLIGAGLAGAAVLSEEYFRRGKERANIDTAAESKDVLIEQIPRPKFIYERPASDEARHVKSDIFDEVDSAWALLEDRRAGFETAEAPAKSARPKKRARPPAKPKLVGKVRYNVLLAAENITAPEKKIEFVKVDENGAPDTPRFKVEKGSPLGVGTRYKITAPDGYAVLAIKRAIRIQNKFEEVIYTPYSPALDAPVVREKGFDYLLEQLASARLDLRAKRIPSRAFPDKLLADIVPLKVALALSMIEHIDPFVFKKRASGLAAQTKRGQQECEIEVMKKMANEALVVAGCNREWSYAYASSSAGARGLFQFIPETYNAVRTLYHKAKLDSNFVRGMNEHKNAAKASLLLFDSDLSYFERGHREFLQKNPKALGMYLAAAYNGGAGRAAKAIKEHGGKWTEHVLPETRDYIAKFNALMSAMAETK